MLRNLLLNRPKSVLNNHTNPIKQREKDNSAGKLAFTAYEPAHDTKLLSGSYDKIECRDLILAGDARANEIRMKPTAWLDRRDVVLCNRAHVDNIHPWTSDYNKDEYYVTLKDYATAGSIEGNATLAGSAKADTISGKNVELLDKAKAKSVTCFNSELSDGAEAKEVIGYSVTMKDNAKAGTVGCYEADLKGKSSAGSLVSESTTYLSDDAKVDTAKSSFMELRDNAQAGTILVCNSLSLRGKSKAEAACGVSDLVMKSQKLSLQDQASVQDIGAHNFNVVLSDSAKADKISTSGILIESGEENYVDISDHASVGNINCTDDSTKVVLRGPVEIRGDIEFKNVINDGNLVIVEKQNGELPVLRPSQVIGGTIRGNDLKLKDVYLKGNESFESIEVLGKANIAGNSRIQDLVCQGGLAVLSDSARTDNLYSKGDVYLVGTSSAGNIVSSGNKVVLQNSANASNITTTGNVELYDNAYVTNLLLNNEAHPQTVTLTGSADISGQVNFKNNQGIVIVRQDEAGHVPVIRKEQVIGGTIVKPLCNDPLEIASKRACKDSRGVISKERGHIVRLKPDNIKPALPIDSKELVDKIIGDLDSLSSPIIVDHSQDLPQAITTTLKNATYAAGIAGGMHGIPIVGFLDFVPLTLVTRNMARNITSNIYGYESLNGVTHAMSVMTGAMLGPKLAASFTDIATPVASVPTNAIVAGSLHLATGAILIGIMELIKNGGITDEDLNKMGAKKLSNVAENIMKYTVGLVRHGGIDAIANFKMDDLVDTAKEALTDDAAAQALAEKAAEVGVHTAGELLLNSSRGLGITVLFRALASSFDKYRNKQDVNLVKELWQATKNISFDDAMEALNSSALGMDFGDHLKEQGLLQFSNKELFERGKKFFKVTGMNVNNSFLGKENAASLIELYQNAYYKGSMSLMNKYTDKLILGVCTNKISNFFLDLQLPSRNESELIQKANRLLKNWDAYTFALEESGNFSAERQAKIDEIQHKLERALKPGEAKAALKSFNVKGSVEAALRGGNVEQVQITLSKLKQLTNEIFTTPASRTPEELRKVIENKVEQNDVDRLKAIRELGEVGTPKDITLLGKYKSDDYWSIVEAKASRDKIKQRYGFKA